MSYFFANFIQVYLEPIACVLYLIALIVHSRSQREKTSKVLAVYYAAAAFLLTMATLNVGKKGNNNIWMYDLVGFLTCLAIGFYFHRLLQPALKKKVVMALVGVYVVYAVYRNLTLDGPRLFDSIGYSILSASIAVYVFMYFHQILKNVTEANILKEFNFWLASGYLVYFVGSFIIFVSYYYLTKSILASYTSAERKLLTDLWGLHNVLLFIGAFSLLIGSLWVTYRKKST